MLLEEEISDFKASQSGKHLYVTGIAIQSGIVNKNRRYYDPETTRVECERYVREEVVERKAFGCLGHPDHPQTDPSLISHRITELTRDGKNWRMKAVIIPEGLGRVAAGILETGGSLSASSRAVGTVTEDEQGIKCVNPDFRLISAADLVIHPSAPDTALRAIREGVFDHDDLLAEAANEIRQLLNHEPISEMDIYRDFISRVSRGSLQEARHSPKYNVKNIPHFEVNGHLIAFHPAKDVPGFSHRVVINDEPKDWLGSQAKPNAKSAIFYYEKHKRELA